MYAMQYTISLPSDYDMQIIRRRVALRGSFLDAFPGLGIKAYLMRERGVFGALVNEYAPFYLWSSPTGMSRFLWEGGGFSTLVADFGRPAVNHWTGVKFICGSAVATSPRAASISLQEIPKNVDPKEAVHRSLDLLEARASAQGVHSTALAVDPFHWQLVQFTLWENTAQDQSETAYEVLHLSRPHIHQLSSG